MDEWIPYSMTATGGLAVGYILGFLNHGLAIRREAASHRRRFRDTINELAATLRAHRNAGLGDAYRDSIPAIRSECVRIMEDIRFGRQGCFKRAAERYLTLQTHETDPGEDPKHRTDAFTDAQRGERYDAARELIGHCLDRIASRAK